VAHARPPTKQRYSTSAEAIDEKTTTLDFTVKRLEEDKIFCDFSTEEGEVIYRWEWVN